MVEKRIKIIIKEPNTMIQDWMNSKNKYIEFLDIKKYIIIDQK